MESDEAPVEGESATRIIAVGGGKGGVGKSMFAANVALLLSEIGRKVTLVDADLGGANLHTVLGVPPPVVTLSDFIARRAVLSDVTVQTPYENLSFISGALDDVHAANPKHMQKMRLLRHLAKLDVDYLMLDLGAGTSLNTLDLFLLADDAIIVVLPEPTSVENAYRFLKAAFMRRLSAMQHVYGIGDIIQEAKAHRNKLNIKTPADLIVHIKRHDAQLGEEIEQQMARFSPWVVLNQVRFDEYKDQQVAADMASASRRFFGIPLRVLGTMPHDDDVRRAIRERQPLVKKYPRALSSDALRGLAMKLTGEQGIRVRAA